MLLSLYCYKFPRHNSEMYRFTKADLLIGHMGTQAQNKVITFLFTFMTMICSQPYPVILTVRLIDSLLSRISQRSTVRVQASL